MDSRWLLIMGLTLFTQTLAKKEQLKMPNNHQEVQKLFTEFFPSNPAEGTHMFFKFMEESRKAWKIPGAAGKKVADDDADSSSDEAKEPGDKSKVKEQPVLPLSAKTFAFYMKVYQCQHSSVYKSFLIDYKKGETEVPKDEMEDSWLLSMASGAESIDTSQGQSVNDEDIENKILALDNSQLQTLKDSEKQMPRPAVSFVHFAKSIGCQNSNEPKYQDFKIRYRTEVIERIRGKPEPQDKRFYITKADSIIEDIKNGY